MPFESLVALRRGCQKGVGLVLLATLPALSCPVFPPISVFTHGSSEDVNRCVDQALEQLGPHNQQLENFVIFANESQLVCEASTSAKIVNHGCRMLAKLSWEILARGLRVVRICGDTAAFPGEGDCQNAIQAAVDHTRLALATFAEYQNSGPLADISSHVERLDNTFSEGLKTANIDVNVVFSQVSKASQSLAEIVRWSVWRANNWLWLMDLLSADKVVQSEWGAMDTNGAHDSNSVQPLVGEPPIYRTSGPEYHGMRWDIVGRLLQPKDTLMMVEIGVFAGHFSNILLETLPGLRLYGIDPYVGKDNTFPGTYSKDLNPDVALANAAQIFNKYPDRATLLPAYGREIVNDFPDGSLDALFIDGCHYYDCVREDLELWLPKMKPGGLVCGHDFSPQWPGVVRAVHEKRGGQVVNIGMDWMYWWHV